MTVMTAVSSYHKAVDVYMNQGTKMVLKRQGKLKP